ncbi:MAG: serine hydrolase domain-containing protein [Egibacteraceae bacterium]
MRCAVGVLVGLLVLAAAGCDGTDGSADTDRQADTDAAFADFDETTPGCAVGVYLEGHVVVETAHGAADLQAGTPFTADTVIDVASVSKQITAGAVMGLIVDGDLDLDDDLTDWLPDLDITPGTVTVADLVHHTSGLPDYVDLLDAEPEEVTTAVDALSALEGVAVRDPGTVFEYSNTNYFLLGQLVESVTGRTLVDHAADAVFAPLGMLDSRYRDDQDSTPPGEAVGYYDEGDGTFEPAVSRWRQTGDGAAHTTVGDLLRWARVFLDAPTAHGVGSPEWRELMLTPGPIPDDDGSRYAGGISLYDDVNGRPALSHSGGWVGVSAHLQIQPDDNLAVAVACNIDDLDAEALAEEVVRVWTD